MLRLLGKHLRPCDKKCLIGFSQTTVRVERNLLIKKCFFVELSFFPTISLPRHLTDILRRFHVSGGVFWGKNCVLKKTKNEISWTLSESFRIIDQKSFNSTVKTANSWSTGTLLWEKLSEKFFSYQRIFREEFFAFWQKWLVKAAFYVPKTAFLRELFAFGGKIVFLSVRDIRRNFDRFLPKVFQDVFNICVLLAYRTTPTRMFWSEYIFSLVGVQRKIVLVLTKLLRDSCQNCESFVEMNNLMKLSRFT